jgi:esterase
LAYLDHFHYQFYGPPEGRKWVFLHGLMGFLNNWRTIIKAIESTERVLVFDQRGHGRSFKPENGYDPEDYADDLKKILDELGWDKIILVGHSMGGRNALNFASRFPERVEKLIIEDIAPSGDPEGWHYYDNLLNAVPTPFKSRTEARLFFQNELKNRVQDTGSIDVLSAFLYANMEDQKDGTVSWRFSPKAIVASAQQARAGDRWDEVKNLSMPTLWIRGENSRDLCREDWQKVVSMNRVIEGVEIPEARHWVHSDQPLAFSNVIRQFVGGFP